jgi:hypothetical protein
VLITLVSSRPALTGSAAPGILELLAGRRQIVSARLVRNEQSKEGGEAGQGGPARVQSTGEGIETAVIHRGLLGRW